MKDLMQKTIELLKTRVNRNLEIIRQNQKVIKEILKEPVSDQRTEKLKAKYDLNKELLLENNDFINIQLTLINFIDKYKNSMVLAGNSDGQANKHKSENKDYFELTVNGEIPFDTNHPMFRDDHFFAKLLKYYQDNEEYEMCQNLLDIKKG